jgi:hypothetical protein
MTKKKRSKKKKNTMRIHNVIRYGRVIKGI